MISVVMTTYNAAQYVDRAVQSILDQTVQDFEFIIVDDASTDDTAQKIRAFHDPRIRLSVNEKNFGQTRSLNRALKMCTRDLVARMDADDVAYPERFERQLSFLKANADIDLVGSWARRIGQEGRAKGLFKVPCAPLEIKCYLSVSGDLGYWSILHPTIMLRKRMLDETGGFNETEGNTQGYPQDYELWSRTFEKYRFANLKEVLLDYRVLPQSDSRKFDQLRDRLNISRRKIKRFLPAIDETSLTSLARMLEFLPQEDRIAGSRVLKWFEEYFTQIFGKESELAGARKIKEQLKLYYLPLLARTNAGLACQTYWSVLRMYPQEVVNIKYYRKCVKALFRK